MAAEADVPRRRVEFDLIAFDCPRQAAVPKDVQPGTARGLLGPRGAARDDPLRAWVERVVVEHVVQVHAYHSGGRREHDAKARDRAEVWIWREGDERTIRLER